MAFLDFLTEEIAIDLGTANTLIIHNDKVVVDSPSIVARDRTSGKIIAVGREANMMQGKTHENIKTIRPLKDGVIADFDASEKMISMLIKAIPALKKKLFPPSLRMVICIPSGITEVEKRAVQDSARHMNAKDIYLIYEPMAAAIGSSAFWPWWGAAAWGQKPCSAGALLNGALGCRAGAGSKRFPGVGLQPSVALWGSLACPWWVVLP